MAAGRHTIFPQSIHSLTFLIDYFILPSLTLFSFDGLSYIGSSTTSAHLLASILVYSNFPTVTQDKLSHLLKPYFQQLLLLILSPAKDITLGSLPSPTSTFSSLSDQSLQIHTFVSSIKKKIFVSYFPRHLELHFSLQQSSSEFLIFTFFSSSLAIHFIPTSIRIFSITPPELFLLRLPMTSMFFH